MIIAFSRGGKTAGPPHFAFLEIRTDGEGSCLFAGWSSLSGGGTWKRVGYDVDPV